MDLSRLSRSLVALALCALSLPALAAAGGRSGVSGRIVNLSAAAQTVTVQAADGRQTLLRVTPASRLWRNGSPVGLAGLALRDTVLTGQVDRNTLRVVSLRTRGPAVTTTRGGLAALDVARRSLSVATPAGTREFLLTPATLFVRNGRAATPADLTSRDALVVHALPATAGTPTAADVEADGPEAGEVEGAISAVSGADVTITPEQGDAVTVHVADSTVIRLHGSGGETAGTLADLKTGMEAEAKFDPVSFAAFRIEAGTEDGGGDGGHPAQVEGQVTAVDATARTITLAPEHGSPVTLTTDGSTRIRLDGAAAALTDIPAGAKAEAEYDPATNLATRIQAQSQGDDGEHEAAEVEGKVTAVSAASITIAPEHGAAVTLTIDASTVIVIDGKPGAAAGIQTGDRAEAKYDRTSLAALGLRIESEHGD